MEKSQVITEDHQELLDALDMFTIWPPVTEPDSEREESEQKSK